MSENLVSQFFKTIFGSFFNDLSSLFSRSSVILRYVRYIFLFSLIAACAVGGYFGYQWNVLRQQRNAQQVFINAQDEYEAIIATDDASIAKNGIERLVMLEKQVSGLATAFDIAQLRINALVKHGMHDDALQAMKQVVDNMSLDAAMYNPARVKYALLLLDSETEKDTGLSLLAEIGYDQTAVHNDYALFYLGQFYWVTGELDKAREAWQHLVDQHKDDHVAPSLWASVVQEKLALISFVE